MNENPNKKRFSITLEVETEQSIEHVKWLMQHSITEDTGVYLDDIKVKGEDE